MLGEEVPTPHLIVPDKTAVYTEEIVCCLAWTRSVRRMNRVPVEIRVFHDKIGADTDEIRISKELGEDVSF